MKRIFSILILLLISPHLMAKPETLMINKKLKPRSSDRRIMAVHQEIHTKNQPLAVARYAILQGMLKTKGYAWVYEGEGDDYILARFDYRGNTIVMKIEYSDSLIQLKYHSSWGDFNCQNNVEGICYDNERGYYNYVKNLRHAISKQI